MEELMIQTHSFEESKGELKKFSEQTTTDLDLKKVDTSKGIGEFLFGGGLGFDHKVTGSELNSLTSQIQTHLISINKLHKDFINEFGQVYNALEALDKDYIQAILIAVKSAQKANEEVKDAQGDIEKTIALQKKTIKVLEQFKVKIDKYDIDKMVHDIQGIRKILYSFNEMKAMIDSLDHLADIDSLWSGAVESDKKLTSLADKVESLVLKMQLIEKLELDSINHLGDVDDIWNLTETLSQKADIAEETITKQAETIATITECMNSINKTKHIQDIDVIYDDCDKLKNDIATMKDTVSKQEKVISNLEDSLLEQQNKSEEFEKMISKKMKLAYLVGGSTIGLVVIEYILLMMR